MEVVTSKKLDSGEIVEMIYLPEENKTLLAMNEIGKDGKEEIVFKEFIELKDKDSTILYPLDPKDPLVKGRFIKFPSGIEEYKDNPTLFKEMCRYIQKYLYVKEDFIPIAASYVLMTWLYDRFSVLPYLRFIGTFGVGKTRALDVLGGISYKAMMIGGAATAPSIFRTVDKIRGTFCLDEADYRSSELHDTIVKILNSGYAKGSPVIRMDQGKNKTFETKVFEVFCPKIIATRKRYGDPALESRCITQQLLPYIGDEIKKPVHLQEEFEEESESLRNKLLLFRFNNFKKEIASDPFVKELVSPRVQQIFLALISTASLIHPEVVEEVTEYAKNYEKDIQAFSDNPIEADIVVCMLELIKEFSESKEKSRGIHLKEIAERYNEKFYYDVVEREDSVFTGKNYRISPNRIGAILTELGIKKLQGNHGYFVPPEEFKKVSILGRRYNVIDSLYKSSGSLDEWRADDAKKKESSEKDKKDENKKDEGPYKGIGF